MSQWQHISTAPQDGTEILGCDEDGIRCVVRWGKSNHVPIYGWIRQVELYGEEVDSFDALYWVPIPDPPLRGHAHYCGLADNHEGACAAMVTRMLGV